MDGLGLQLYFDASTGLYRYADEAEEDSGVEDLPFSFYPTEMYTSPDIHTQTSTCTDADDEDLTYVDDVRDGDYLPNKTCPSKKGKRPYRRRQYNGNTCLSQLMTPEKQRHKMYGIGDYGVDNHIRHYARKDRTPDTIQKMMERHRESERVRHHTLNESMKDVCLRVPGYDPDVKETKVIQMQRIIAYECFLENTLNSVCEKVGVNPKTLKMNTHFITDAMKSTPIEDFYQPSNYKTSDVEEEETVNVKTEVLEEDYSSSSVTTGYKVARKQSNNRHLHKYRQEKISSPTIDSTTNDFIQVMPLSPPSFMPGYQFITNGRFPAQCFIPIDNTSQHLQSSQESGIKMEETQSTCYDDDNHFHEEIGTFMDHGICVESEHLKTVTPSFMKEEVNSASTTYDHDQYQAFDLSSPIRQHEKVFLQSPKSTGTWSKQTRPCFLGKADTPMGKEMQSVSPENVLETKPKFLSAEDLPIAQPMPAGMMTKRAVEETDMMQLTANQIIQATQNTNEMQHVFDPKGRKFSTYKVFSGISRENGCIKVQHIYIPKFENGTLKLDWSDNSSGKNKRKRYTPLRTTDDTSEVYVESEEEEECDGMSSQCGETTDTDIEDHEFEMEQSQPQPQLGPVGSVGGPYPYGFPQNWGYPAPAPCRGQGKKVKYAKPLVDHRKSTWMNGFMMFSKLNRPKFTGEHPGVHTSQIQKLMGEAWRKLTIEEKQPYKDKAKEWCERMKNAGENANKATEQTDKTTKPVETGEKADKAKTTSTTVTNSSAAKSSDQKEKDSSPKTGKSKKKSSKSGTVNSTPTKGDNPQE